MLTSNVKATDCDGDREDDSFHVISDINGLDSVENKINIEEVAVNALSARLSREGALLNSVLLNDIRLAETDLTYLERSLSAVMESEMCDFVRSVDSALIHPLSHRGYSGFQPTLTILDESLRRERASCWDDNGVYNGSCDFDPFVLSMLESLDNDITNMNDKFQDVQQRLSFSQNGETSSSLPSTVSGIGTIQSLRKGIEDEEKALKAFRKNCSYTLADFNDLRQSILTYRDEVKQRRMSMFDQIDIAMNTILNQINSDDDDDVLNDTETAFKSTLDDIHSMLHNVIVEESHQRLAADSRMTNLFEKELSSCYTTKHISGEEAGTHLSHGIKKIQTTPLSLKSKRKYVNNINKS